MKTQSLKKQKMGDKVFDVVNMIILALFTLIILYPIVNTIAYSFNDGTDA